MKPTTGPLGQGIRSSVFRAALFAGALASLSACAKTSDDAATLDADGHAVAYRIVGAGQPAIVMISGLGDGMNSFRDVAPELAESATVILYDRAGYGASERSSRPRDAAAADRELTSLLAGAGVQGRYVVLGHSLGGLFAEYHAAMHPDRVSGLILEDSRPFDFTQRCEAAKAGMCAPPRIATRFAPFGAQEEYGEMPVTMSEIATLNPAQNLPVLILSRDVAGTSSKFDALWGETQADLASRYANARHLMVKSGHYIHRDQRVWFVKQVRAFLKQRSAE